MKFPLRLLIFVIMLFCYSMSGDSKSGSDFLKSSNYEEEKEIRNQKIKKKKNKSKVPTVEKKNEEREKILKNEDQEANFNSCEVIKECKICTYSQILNLEKCQKTGFIEILKCDEMDGIIRSCSKTIWIPKLFVVCVVMWISLLFLMSKLKEYKDKEERKIVNRIVSGV